MTTTLLPTREACRSHSSTSGPANVTDTDTLKKTSCQVHKECFELNMRQKRLQANLILNVQDRLIHAWIFKANP